MYTTTTNVSVIIYYAKCANDNGRSTVEIVVLYDIKIVTLFKLSSSYSIMAEGVGCVVDSENGSFHSQITWRLPRKATQAAVSAWKLLCARKFSRGDPRAGENGPYSEPASLCE